MITTNATRTAAGEDLLPAGSALDHEPAFPGHPGEGLPEEIAAAAPADVFDPLHPCQQLAPLMDRARFPPPVRIDLPTGTRKTYEPDSLRAQVAAWVDENGFDLAAPLTAEIAGRIAAELDTDPHSVRVAMWNVRQGRGIRARHGGGGQRGKKRQPAMDVRTLALLTAERLTETGDPECLLRAAALLEKLLESEGSR